jgi:hypothetical protein
VHGLGLFNKLSIRMKIFNSIFIILFILFAGLQYNDPDPYIWVSIYLYGAFVSYLALTNRFKPGLYYIGFTIYIGYALFLLFDKTGAISWATEHHAENIVQSMKATKPWIEETREFGGLAILLTVFVMDHLRGTRNY